MQKTPPVPSDAEATARISLHEATPAIAAIVCTSGNYNVIQDAVASLVAQTLEVRSIEILVIDVSSDLQIQRKFWADFDLPANGRLVVAPGASFTKARNIALRDSHAPVVAFLEDSAIALPGWCATLVESFNRVHDAGVVGGPVEALWPQTRPDWLRHGLRDFFGIVDFGKEARTLEPGEIVAATNLGFRREALEKVGGFTALFDVPHQFAPPFDNVTAGKLAASGFVCFYEPEAKILRRIPDQTVTQEWARRSACWRAVAELFSEIWSESASEECWTEIGDYLVELPREMRSVRGLFLDSADGNQFDRQCHALAALIRLALLDGSDPAK